MSDERKPDAVVDLLSRAGTGPLWGMASADLNATLLAWPPGHEVVEHTTSELDVLLVVLEGGGMAKIDEREHGLVPGSALLVEKGSSRAIRAGADGLRYLSVHMRRGPLQVAGLRRDDGSLVDVKRSDALRVLSHQHHQGLFAALQLKRAGAETAGEARRVFLDFFEREGARHFRAEEELLMPAYARHAGFDDPGIVRVLTEHVDLRRRAQELEADADPNPSALHELGERLEGHIRFEERELFPMIERALPDDELERLGSAFARAEASSE
jgi:uncharacterized cupin superfamily protein